MTMSLGGNIGLGLAVAKARTLGRRVPLFVQLMPTERCNLRCRYCYADFGYRVREDFPLDNILRVIDGLSRLGTRFIMVAGGEPMMRRDIGTIVREITSRGIECSVNTNGLAVAERIGEIASADMLSISLDGTRETHDYYRGEGSYEVAVAAARAARSRGLRVQFQFTMTRSLKENFQHVHKVAVELGCFIGLNFLRPQQHVDGQVDRQREASDEELREFLHWLIAAKPPRLPYPRHMLEYVLRWPYPYTVPYILRASELKGFHPIPCASGRFLIAIDNRGDIYPCTKLFYTKPLGNCLEGDIERAWRELEKVECQACLDPGCNYLNQLLQLNPRALRGFIRLFR